MAGFLEATAILEACRQQARRPYTIGRRVASLDCPDQGERGTAQQHASVLKLEIP